MRRRLAWIVGGVIVALTLAVVAVRLRPLGTAPPGQTAAANLNLEQFRRTFNQASHETRVLILLSPT